MESTHEQRLARSGLTLPPALPAFGQYVPSVLHGAALWVGGHFGTRPDGSIHVGRCGREVSVAEAREAARSAALNLLATVREALGSLDRVVRVVQVYGVVNSTPEFIEHTAVIDAASDVLVEVFMRKAPNSTRRSPLDTPLGLETVKTVVAEPLVVETLPVTFASPR